MKRVPPAAARNRGPIAEALKATLSGTGFVLEVASGSGAHVAYLAERYPEYRFQPSDLDDSSFDSICSHIADARTRNISQPVILDATDDTWPVLAADVILCFNMIHIAPFSACMGLMAGAARTLVSGGRLVLYGPFFHGDGPPVASNAAFDKRLKEMDESYGVRQKDGVVRCAAMHGLTLRDEIAMPANNSCLIFRSP